MTVLRRPRATAPLPLLGLLLGLLPGLPAAAQDAGAPDPAPGAPRALHAQPPGRGPFPRGERDCFDAERWRALLSDRDLDRRELAYDQLVVELRRCAQARQVLEGWARKAPEPELAWTARMALREVRRMPELSWTPVDRLIAPQPAPGLDADAAPEAPMADLRRFPGLPEGLFAFGGNLGLHAPRLFALPMPAPGQAGTRTYVVRVGGDGVRVEIVELQDGEARRRTFEAASLEELLGQHPELDRELPELRAWVAQRDAGGALRLRWTDGRVQLRLDPSGVGARPRRIAIGGHEISGADGPPTDRLGVWSAPVSPERAARLGLEAGLGLVVDSTFPGTLAALLELRRGDVLLELCGRPLRAIEDLGRALAARQAGAPVVLHMVDRDGQDRTLTWHPEPAPAAPAAPAGPSPSPAPAPGSDGR